MIGTITGAMIPIIGLLAASGILKGFLKLFTFNLNWIDPKLTTYIIINAIGGLVAGLMKIDIFGFPSFFSKTNPNNIWAFVIASAITLVISFVCVYLRGFIDEDVDQAKEAQKKISLKMPLTANQSIQITLKIKTSFV